MWRLDYLMTNPVLRSMFSAVQTKLDIGKEMDAGRIIVINNSKAILADEGAEFFGRFFIALIARAAQQRAGRRADEKKPCYVYIDECQSVIAKDAKVPYPARRVPLAKNSPHTRPPAHRPAQRCRVGRRG